MVGATVFCAPWSLPNGASFRGGGSSFVRLLIHPKVQEKKKEEQPYRRGDRLTRHIYFTIRASDHMRHIWRRMDRSLRFRRERERGRGLV